MKMVMMINGEFVPPESATISVWDRAIYFGDGVYEVLQSYNGKIWAFDEHFGRFKRSLREIDITDVNLEKIRGWVLEAFEYAKIPNGLIYYHISRGIGLRSHIPKDISEPQFLLYIHPAHDNTEIAQNGVKAITYPDIRWKRCDIKSLNLLPNVLAENQAYKRGYDDAVFVTDGKVIEGASSTFFAVIGGKVITRKLDKRVLPGITRKAIEAITNRLGIEFVEREVSLEEAYRADELFLAGTGFEIRGIVKLEDTIIGDGKVGPITKKIIDFFIEYTRSGGEFSELVNM